MTDAGINCGRVAAAAAVQAAINEAHAIGAIDDELTVLFTAVVEESDVHPSAQAGDFVDRFAELLRHCSVVKPLTYYDFFATAPFASPTVGELEFLLHCVRETFAWTRVSDDDMDLLAKVASWIADAVDAKHGDLTVACWQRWS